MILEQNQATEIKQLIDSATDVAVCLPSQPNADLILSAAGLGLGLESDKRRVWFSGGFDKMAINYPYKESVLSEVGNRDLVVELPLGEDMIEKISTLSVDNKMKIIVEPKESQSPIKKEEIKITYQGLKVNVLIVVGAGRLDDLGQVYDQNRLLFQEVPIIHFYLGRAVPFGRYNFQIKSEPASAWLPVFFQETGLALNIKGAKVFLWALRYLTNSFKPGTPAQVFKTAAWLMDQGVKEAPAAGLPNNTALKPKTWKLSPAVKPVPTQLKGGPFKPPAV